MKMKPFLPVVFALLVAGHAPGAQAPTPRPADVVLPGPPDALTVDIQSNLYSAFSALTRVLEAAGVRFGLEGPASDPAAPAVDLARLRSNPIPLGGRRLGEALDLIVKAAPQYRWAERDGIIVVRSTADGVGILDRRIPQFTLTDASPRVAMEGVMSALDPTRPRNVGIVGFGRQGSGAGFKPERIGRNVTLSMTDATLQAILTAIARENRELSWTIRYDAAPANVEHATLTFIELGVEVTALSPYAQRTQATVPGPLPANRITISATLSTMLMNYMDRNGLRVSIEEVGQRQGEPPPSPVSLAGMPQLELPDQPAAALARIVALDSRYEWSEKNGRFLVRPKTGAAGRLALLDQPVNGFRATNEPATAVIERAGQFIGTVRSSPALAAAQRAGAPASSAAMAMSQPIDVNVTGPATVRDVFDAIADATGSSWTMRPSFSPGRPTTISIQWRGLPRSPVARGGSGPMPSSLMTGGWSTNVTITTPTDLSPPAAPMLVPSVTVPAALDRPMPQTSLDMPPGIGAFRQIGTRVLVPMGIEDVPRARRDDPRYGTRMQAPLVVGPSQFSDGLYVLLERLTDYELLPAEGIVNVAPSSLARLADYVMNRPIDTFTVKGAGAFRAVGELRRRLDPQFVPADWVGAGQGTLNTPVTMSLTRTTPRAILNEIARQHGRLMWTSTFDGANATVADWVLTLVPLDNAGPPIALSARGGALAPPATAVVTSNPLAIAPGARSVLFDLPVTPMAVRSMLQQAVRATGVSMGYAGVTPLTPYRGAPAEFYNLSGLSMDEMLAKLTEFSTEYVTSVEKGVYHVRIRETPRDLAQWLDQRVAKYEQRFESLQDAMNAVATIGAFSGRAMMGSRAGGGGAGSVLPPGAAPPGGPPGRGAPPTPPGGVVGGVVSSSGGVVTMPSSPARDAMLLRTQKTIILSMTDVTIREILDEIARQFGSVLWVVEQRSLPAAPGSMVTTGNSILSLSFASESWTIGTSVR